MRSVYVFIRAGEDDMSAYLDSVASRAEEAKQWFYPDKTRKILYIEPANELYDELEPEAMEALLNRFDGELPRCVCIDVSRNYSGLPEVKSVVSGLLRRFDGVAMDDHSDRLWTLGEIESEQREDGGPCFFISTQR